jgi:hypothetical protein
MHSYLRLIKEQYYLILLNTGKNVNFCRQFQQLRRIAIEPAGILGQSLLAGYKKFWFYFFSANKEF